MASAAEAADLPEYQAQFGVSSGRTTAAMRTYAVCREAIAQSAAPFAPVDIQTVLIGPIRRSTFTTRTAPLHVRIIYETKGGRETRESAVDCRVARNAVVSITER
jgi:thiazole synthase ThiGH ThiG subunit